MLLTQGEPHPFENAVGELFRARGFLTGEVTSKGTHPTPLGQHPARPDLRPLRDPARNDQHA